MLSARRPCAANGDFAKQSASRTLRRSPTGSGDAEHANNLDRNSLHSVSHSFYMTLEKGKSIRDTSRVNLDRADYVESPGTCASARVNNVYSFL